MCSTLKFHYLLVLFAAIFALSLASCEKNGDYPEMPTLSVDPVLMHFSKDLGAQMIEITSNREWFIEQMPEWLAVNQQNGPGGTHQVFITAIDNDLLDKTDIRVDSFLVRVSSVGQFVVVYQSGIPIVKALKETGIFDDMAVANGQWIYSGDDYTITEIGFAWGAQGETATLAPALKLNGGVVTYTAGATFRPTKSGVVPPTNQIISGDFSLPLLGLDAATNYVYKAYVKDDEGNVYYSNNETLFTTLDPPTSMAISGYRALGSATSTVSVSVSRYILGTVITDRAAGNFSADRLIIADGTTKNDVITLSFDDPAQNTFNAGDELKIKIYGSTLANDSYGVLVSKVALPAIAKESTGNAVTPVIVADPANIADYESMYVKFDNTQIAAPFDTKYSKWNDGTDPVFMMEVNGMVNSFNLEVLQQANFAGNAPSRGSGTVQGVVVKTSARIYAFFPRNAADIALSGDAGTRFATNLAPFSMQAPYLSNDVYEEEDALAYIMIPYRNGDSNPLSATVSVDISGVAADGLEIDDLTNPIVSGNGVIRVPITGRPTTQGAVLFTILGLEAWLPTGSNTLAATITARPAPSPADGNFQAVWTSGTYTAGTISVGAYGNTVGNPIPHGALSNFSSNPTSNWPEEVPLRGKTIPSVNVSALRQTGFVAPGTGNGNWNNTSWGGGGWNANTDEMAPVRYIEFTVTPTEGMLDLSGLLFVVRFTAATVTLSVQYAINDGEFKVIARPSAVFTATSSYHGFIPSTASNGSVPTPVNLARVSELQNIQPNTKVTFRVVPMGNDAAFAFALSSGWSTNPLGVNIFGNLTE